MHTNIPPNAVHDTTIILHHNYLGNQGSALAAKHPRAPTSVRAHRPLLASAPVHVPYARLPKMLPSFPSTPPDVSSRASCRAGTHASPTLKVTRSTSATGVSLGPALGGRATRRAVDSIGFGITEPDAHPPLPTRTCKTVSQAVAAIDCRVHTLVPSSRNW